MPPDQDQIYRLVLEHGDFGIHNMSITMDTDDLPKITSLYDWETGCIVPAILSDPLMALTVDLVVDEAGSPSVIRIDDDSTPEDRVQYDTWSKHYFEVSRPHNQFNSCLDGRDS